jgi:hypothetical protein
MEKKEKTNRKVKKEKKYMRMKKEEKEKRGVAIKI